jgi:hypothetical protein
MNIGQNQNNRYLLASSLAGVLVIFSIWFTFESTKPQSCTIFTASQDGTVLFGNNEDWHAPDLVIGFFPPSASGYGSVHFGRRLNNGNENYEGVVNDQGLAWDLNSVPSTKLNPLPEKPYSHARDNYFTTISKTAATVEESIKIARDFDFGDSMPYQIHVADASGDAVVISPGPDGEMAFTRKPAGDGYLLSTNFNLAIPEKGPKDFRYDTAASMLENLTSSQVLTPDFGGEILNAVHLNNLTTYTLYSNVIDLKNRDIYLYYMSQYDEVIKLDIEEELAKGQRVVEMRDLFTPKTTQAGDLAYKRFETRFKIAQITLILTVVVILVAVTMLIVKKVKSKAHD